MKLNPFKYDPELSALENLRRRCARALFILAALATVALALVHFLSLGSSLIMPVILVVAVSFILALVIRPKVEYEIVEVPVDEADEKQE
ncbi:MAG TPA: hypothetical protein VHQ86_05895 [Candidatus Saccharimonadia bacterium]|nr:hypothetical protein [Candidatus Saccharimonadia bacterium]